MPGQYVNAGPVSIYGEFESRIHSTIGGLCCVCTEGQFDGFCEGETVTTQALDRPGIEFDTQSGKDYVIRSIGNN